MRENFVKSMAIQVEAQIHEDPSFGALHSHFPSQSNMQGRKPEEEIQLLAFSHGCAKFRTPCETT